MSCNHSSSWKSPTPYYSQAVQTDKLVRVFTLLMAPRGKYHWAFFAHHVNLFLYQCQWIIEEFCLVRSPDWFSRNQNWGDDGTEEIQVREEWKLNSGKGESWALEHSVFSTYPMLKSSCSNNRRCIQKADQTSSTWFSQIVLEVYGKF